VTELSFEATPEGDDGIAQRRRLLWAMPTGLYVLGSTAGERGPYNLMTCSLAVQVATTPCVVAVAVEAAAQTHAAMAATGVATLCVLRRDQRALVRRFVKPVEDVATDERGRPVALNGVAVSVAPSGAPFLVDAAGCLDLRVLADQRFESHTLFCCEVVAAAVADVVLEGPASARVAEILRMEDTKMSYGG
jgi:flavin reductase (DIM6/NTAB) family NADH-FMN oxidoreductase RutF